MAAFLFIIHYVRFENSYEDFHENADNIYRVTLDLYNGNEFVVTDCETYAPVGPMLKEKMPEVVDYVRMFHNDGLQDIEVGKERFLEEDIYFADPSVFSVFSVTVLDGDPSKALSYPYKTVLTESLAKKYFNRVNVVGESIKIQNQLYEVTAVIADLPPNTHLKFKALLSHQTLAKMYNWYKDDSWNGNNEYTYLLMVPQTDLQQFNRKLIDFALELKDKIKDERLVAEPIKDIHLLSNKSFEPEVNGSAKVVYFLLIIAVFIIVIAWVNYINLSTARAIERAREVGVRKVMGSMRAQLIYQFLSESIILNFIASILALVIFQTGLPFFRYLTGQPLSLTYFSDQQFWFLFLALLFGGSLLAGFYPAIVLSSFKPSTVLKGKFRTSSHGQNLRRVLVVFQFAATVTIMVCMCAVYLQINYLRTADLGMDINQTLALRVPEMDVSDSVRQFKYQSLKTELLRDPAIQKVARSETVPGLSLHELSTTSDVKRVGHESEGGSYNYYYASIDADFIPALDMKFIAGLNFEDGKVNNNKVIVNEEAVVRLGFSNVEEAIGSKITFYTGSKEPATIIGVLRDFYLRSPKEEQIPMLFRYREGASYFSLKLKTGNTHETMAFVKKTWEEVFPGTVFHYFFIDEKYDQQYRADTQFGQVIASFSGLAVFIACLGLFGLSAFTIVQRTKEIGIRKALGASVFQIVHLLSKDFIKVVMIATLLALPIAYYAVEQWLSSYAVRIPVGALIFAIPVVAILLIALFTVSFQTIKTARENPVNSLKQE